MLVSQGAELNNPSLAKKLAEKCQQGDGERVEFSQSEWNAFNVQGLTFSSLIKVQRRPGGPCFFKPGRRILNAKDKLDPRQHIVVRALPPASRRAAALPPSLSHHLDLALASRVRFVQLAYAKTTEMTVPQLLMQLVCAGAIELDEEKAFAAVTFMELGQTWESRMFWEADGPPCFVKLRDPKGRRMKMVFLGTDEEERTPKKVLLDAWGLDKPSTAVTVDAGTMHPRHCDVDDEESSNGGLRTLPKFQQWLMAAGEEVKREVAPNEETEMNTLANAGLDLKEASDREEPTEFEGSSPFRPGSSQRHSRVEAPSGDEGRSPGFRPGSGRRRSSAAVMPHPSALSEGNVQKHTESFTPQKSKAARKREEEDRKNRFKINDLIYDRMLK